MDDRVHLSVRRLCKQFPLLGGGLFRRKVGAVTPCKDISFDVMRGETFGLIGPSGSGKTTLARLILRIGQPDSGQVLFRSRGGSDFVDLTSATMKALKPLRRELQMVFQDPFSSLNPRMTVEQIVEEPLKLNGVTCGAERHARVEEMLTRVGLHSDSLNRLPNALSGGQRQRVGIARALIIKPSLVVCDEPVSALDVSIQAQIINLLSDLQDELGLTYIFISHDMRLVRQVADRVSILIDGQLSEPMKSESFFASRGRVNRPGNRGGQLV